MPAENNHIAFKPPEDQNVKIWRYMDFTKYVSLLESSELFFARADLFEDPYEGATSHANPKLRQSVYQGKIPGASFKEWSKLHEWIREWTFINCWHMNDYESAAMWKLYAQTNEAIAVQTTYKKLHACLPNRFYVGVVHYIDYEKDWMPEGNTFYPFLHKRKSFEHERELRAIKQDLPDNSEGIEVGKSNPESGIRVPIKTENLIEKVFISPDAPDWFYELTENVTNKFNRELEVKHSSLGKDPIF